MYQMKKFYRKHKNQIVLAAIAIPTITLVAYRAGVKAGGDSYIIEKYYDAPVQEA